MKHNYIADRLLNENLKLRERIEIADPDFYRKLVINDQKDCKNLGHDIRMRIKLKEQ